MHGKDFQHTHLIRLMVTVGMLLSFCYLSESPSYSQVKKDPPKKTDFKIDLPKETPLPPRMLPAIPGVRVGEPAVPLTLNEVLESVEMYFPLLRAAEEERAITGGRLLSAQGPFDTALALSSTNAPYATYENYRFVSGVTQAFTSSGLRVFTNYRGGYGDFPGYGGGAKTADGGEFAAGVLYPLLRDGATDRNRTNLIQADLNRQAAEPFVQRQRLDAQRLASRAFWAWVAAGQRVRIASRAAKLANDRDAQLKQLLANQLIPVVDRADNLQNLFARNAVLAEAERAFAQASVDLSLFLRDNFGQPVVPSLARLPNFPEVPEPDASELGNAIDLAILNRPELIRLRLQRQVQEAELRFARNQLLPALNAVVVGRNDLGYSKPAFGSSRLDRYSVELGFEFQVPYQRSEARGRVLTAEGEIRRTDRLIQFQVDSIVAEVKSLFFALERTHQAYLQARERTLLARQVAEAERVAFQDGFSDIVRVNIREQNAIDAENLEVSALLEFFRAVADYRAALGISEK